MKPLQLVIERAGTPVSTRRFDAQTVVVGRSETADVTIEDGSVSRRHARFFFEQNDWWVEDLGSRNGTEINGRRLAIRTAIHAGDAIRLGSTTLRVADDSASQSSQPRVVATTTTFATEDHGVYSVLRPAADLRNLPAVDDTRVAARLRLLNDVHRALAAPIAKTELLQLLLDQACAVLEPEQAAIFMRTPDGRLEQAASRQSARATSQPMPISSRLAEEVTVKGSAALVFDALSDERFAGAQSIVVSGVRSILAAPLADANGCMGMIALYSSIHVRRFSEQDLEVLVSIASAAATRIRNIDMAEAAAERRALDREIALARDIQMDLLRRRPPDRADMEVSGQVIPARSVGGDFYDFLIADEKLWFIVADVSGKGIGAALMMAVGQTLFRATAASGCALGDVMAQINRELSADNDRAMFVTALAGFLDLSSGRLQIANAGHNLPYLLHNNGLVTLVKATNSIALGVLEDAAYPVTEIAFAPGDAILLYTDGVCDALDETGRAFGAAGLERCLREVGAQPADVVVHRVCDSVVRFAGARSQEDDITVVVIRHRGAS